MAHDGNDGGRKTLLVVDDQATIRNILVQVLKLEGYDVLSGVHGADALQKASEHEGRIDVLITDLMMPYMGGEELIRRLTEARPETRVICLSASFERVVLNRDVLFLPKPFELRSLVSSVEKILNGTIRKDAMSA